MFFSIIVPIYNVEQYLHRCLDSIVNQTYKSFEIILVDDGSTDNSSHICDEYAEKNTEIRVIHQENGGLSDARNSGLKIANGMYVFFIDSDDYIELDALEKFNQILENHKYDIVIGGAKRIEKGKKTIMLNNFYKGEYNGNNFFIDSLNAKTYSAPIWLNCYRKKYLVENDLFFTKGIYHEDVMFSPYVFSKTNNIYCSDIIFYNYIIRANSITTKKDKLKNAIDLMRIAKQLKLDFICLNESEKKTIGDHIISMYLGAISIGKMYKKDRKSFIDKSFFDNVIVSNKNKIKIILFKFNIWLYCKINYIFNKIRSIKF